MKMWVSCSLDSDGNLTDAGKVAYRDGHAIKCTVTLMAKDGEVTRDDDELKVIQNGCGYAVFVPVAMEESYGLDELVKSDEQVEDQQPQLETAADPAAEPANEEEQAAELVGAGADNGKSWW